MVVCAAAFKAKNPTKKQQEKRRKPVFNCGQEK
jgi:hypothetical protein